MEGRSSSRYLKDLVKAGARVVIRNKLFRPYLNHLYLKLSYPQLSFVHSRFSQLFHNLNTDEDLVPGCWKVCFAGRPIKVALTRNDFWLDWDMALSLTGHDVEIKETYSNILQSRNRPDLFIDIGANYGIDSLLFLCHGIKTISFEPNSSCHRYLKRLCADNEVTPDLRPVALSDQPGVALLKYPERETWLGSIDKSMQEDLENRGKVISEEVSQRTLDSFLDELHGKMLIKVDIEGNEYRALRGATQVLTRFKPPVIFECFAGDARKELFSLFQSIDYKIHHLPWKNEARAECLTEREFFESQSTNFIGVP